MGGIHPCITPTSHYCNALDYAFVDWHTTIRSLQKKLREQNIVAQFWNAYLKYHTLRFASHIVEVEVVGYMTVVRDEGENKIFRREKGQDDDNRFNAWR